MDETTQQLLALGLVALAVAAEWLRRKRKNKKGGAGCDGCDTPEQSAVKKESPLRFYRRR
jgi:hypothetical protein